MWETAMGALNATTKKLAAPNDVTSPHAGPPYCLPGASHVNTVRQANCLFVVCGTTIIMLGKTA
jgi:hypothetical protein